MTSTFTIGFSSETRSPTRKKELVASGGFVGHGLPSWLYEVTHSVRIQHTNREVVFVIRIAGLQREKGRGGGSNLAPGTP